MTVRLDALKGSRMALVYVDQVGHGRLACHVVWSRCSRAQLSHADRGRGRLDGLQLNGFGIVGARLGILCGKIVETRGASRQSVRDGWDMRRIVVPCSALVGELTKILSVHIEWRVWDKVEMT